LDDQKTDSFLETGILEKPGLLLDSGFDLLTWTGPWACSPGKTQEGKKCLGLDSGYRKNPGLGPDPARSLQLTAEKQVNQAT